MKIGILTFHWATNYGAILQAFALQTYLKRLGHDVSIINYRPKQYKKTLLGCFFTVRIWKYVHNIREYVKENKLEKFRKMYLYETLLYENLDALKQNPPKCDVYICGSDQVWNPYFTIKGEGKPTSSYFLDFGEKNIKRIAYAVSLGCENYPPSAFTIAQKYIHNFSGISVRENSAISIVEKMGFLNPIKLPDPTLLLLRDDYFFSGKTQIATQKKVFVYFLRNEHKAAIDIVKYLKQNFKVESTNKIVKPYSVEEWVKSINSASLVLTNSFHGMIFSIIFHVPFIVVPAKGSASTMNDRFKTILSYLDLEHRIIYNYDSNILKQIIEKKINWEDIDTKIKNLREESYSFFQQVL